MLETFAHALKISEPLSLNDRAAVLNMEHRIRELQAGGDLRQDAGCAMIVSGLVCSYDLLPHGRRSILALHIPVDFCGLQELGLESDVRLCALTTAQVILVPHTEMMAAMTSRPAIAHAVWVRTLADGRVLRQWMTNIGARNAYCRTAHLLCELLSRYESDGLAKAGAYEFGLTQSDIADALGLSVVHVNRVLQRLRNVGLIARRAKRLHVLDRDRLESVSEFSAAYLNARTLGRARGSPPTCLAIGAAVPYSLGDQAEEDKRGWR